MNRYMFVVLLGFTVSFTQFATASIPGAESTACLNPEVKNVDDSAIRAVSFFTLDSFMPEQQMLLNSFFNKTVSQQDFDTWSVAHNDQAATFVAVTFALSKIDLYIDATNKVTGLDMVDGITDIKGVRLIANFNQTLFTEWMAAGAKYDVHLVTGAIESGNVTFADGDQKGGALHCGFDTQGYTHYNKTPYLHWNYKESDGSTDIHLDGNDPWIWGFIPNPAHLEYTNSDVRAWYLEYLAKYGDPGFTIMTLPSMPLSN